MPRFHFDIIDDQNSVIDDEGLEFFDAVTMERETMRAAGSMLGDLARFPREPWTMIIRDEQRKTVATLTFAAR